MDDLEQKVLKDYGQYMGVPTKGYADGGLAEQVPDPNANMDAWNNRANAGVVKDTAYRPGVAVSYSGGKWHQTVPQKMQQPIYGGVGKNRTIIGYEMVDAPTSGRGGKAPYDVQYTYDPREYIWDKFGNKTGRLATTFGNSLTSSGLTSTFKENALGVDKALRYELGGLVDKYAHGGEVKGYAEGDLVTGMNEEDPYSYAPIPAPEMQQTMAPNFMPLQTGQVEPSGGGAAPQAMTVAPAMASANPELNALLAQYATGADYGPELRQARTDRQAREKDFNSSLDKLMTASDEGPTKSEMYWKLAAAFGTPSKTGAFGEGLSQAAGAMAEHKKEERASATAKRKLLADITLKKQELALEGAKDTEKTLLGLQSEANKDKREFIKAQVKDFIDSGKPQSNAGKIAKDKGFVPGTKDYQDEVDKQVNLEIEKTVGAINAQLQTGKIALANLGIQQGKAEREAIKLEPDERKAIRDDEDAMFAAKSTIKNMNTALSFVDQAFSNTAADQAQFKKLKQTNPDDPRVKATEELENLIGQNVVGSLKTTFGGNATEGERRALQELGGLGSANKEVRKAILKRAIKALEEAADYRGARIIKIETGGYRKKTEEK